MWTASFKRRQLDISRPPHTCVTRVIAIGATVVLALSASGCGGEASSSDDGINVATSSNGLGFLPLFVGIEKGIYEDAGLKVTTTSVKGGSNGIAAIAGGSAQFYAGLPETQITASAAGSKSVIVSALTTSNDYKIVARSGITELDQLKGKKFGMLSEGNGTDVQPRWLLDHAGVGSKNVEFIASGSVPDRLSALQADQVDATILNTPFELQAKHAGFNIVADFADAVEGYPAQVIMANPDVLDERPEDVRAFLKATLAASQYIYDHPQEVVPIAAKHSGIKKSLAKEGVEQFLKTKHYSTTGDVSTGGLNWAIDVLSEYTDQDVPSRPDDMIDLSYLPGDDS